MILSKIALTISLTGFLLLSSMTDTTVPTDKETGMSSVSTTLSTSALSLKKSQASVGEIISNRARELIGKPYVFGGDSEEIGFDSSGMVVECFRTVDIELPHKSSEIYRLVDVIDNEEDLQEGDLVFYRDPNSRDKRIVSVSVYVGKGQVVHAANIQSGVELRDMEKEKKDMILCYGRINTTEPLQFLR